MNKVRAAVVEAPGVMKIREFERPRIGPQDALLKVEMAGVCGTDPKIYHGEITQYSLPMILGHEILGFIEEIGEEAAKAYRVRAGDRVVMEANIQCGRCEYCVRGEYKYCTNSRGYGTKISSTVPPHLWGAYAEYLYVAPGSLLHKISPAVPAAAAVLTNAAVANGIQWLRFIGGVKIGDRVVIQGVGPQGMAAVLAARESGASLILMIGRSSDWDRFKLAREFGAHETINVDEEDPVERVRDLTGGEMADIVLDVTGSTAALAKAPDLIRKQGTLVVAGLTGAKSVTPMLMDKIVWNELSVKGVFSKSSQATVAAVRLVESGRYPLEKMVSHIYPLERAEEAVRAAGGDLPGVEPIKVAVVP
ncbi:MAG TPA: alcohol dehydrogenase catalytic domain-containing protein [bacterium]|nr:alcohol dehydrogenase catalytic domain-containing protein [bacterium]